MLLEIALISNSNEKIKLILATSFGNTNLKCNGEDESAAVIKYGWTIDEHYNVNPNVTRSSPLETHFSDDYHVLELSRYPEIMVFKVDGEINQWNTTDLPMNLFDSEVRILVTTYHYSKIILNFCSFSFIYLLVCLSVGC